jgi:hypothetical protein
MAPMEVIDYVVVHEMCHMVHMNHDRSFWRLVGKIMPEYERYEHWLAVSGWRMEDGGLVPGAKSDTFYLMFHLGNEGTVLPFQ